MTSNDKQTDEFQDQSFKEQLDRVATERREDQQGTNTNPIVEKITEFIPAASKILGTGSKNTDTSKQEGTDIPGPPHRPDHDDKIEGFIRDQHRSKTEDGELNNTQ
ncbi:unnamed protein product [Clonostachys chloroleuca]|uniref:Uncharacterized protein n=1 Tax=Clonostachys chloroleuca TaxID=1926264 RepID=A0AA35MG51_9HYPO|nr:unnamed protein product [Clonostachys chloroleuca]